MLATVDPQGMIIAALPGGSTLRWQGSIGRRGLRADKREGDGATPIGLLALRRVLYRADRIAPPRCAVPRCPLAPHDGWCDDLNDPSYNQHVVLPFAGRHEALWREDGIYDVIGVLGWNDAPVLAGRGSAIFLHVAAADSRPTDGCVALPLQPLRELLAAGLRGLVVSSD